MELPERIAKDIVDRFSWGSNVMVDGRLVGQQVVVAAEIAKAIRAEREATKELREAALSWRMQARPRSRVACSLVYAIDKLDQ